MGKSVNQVRLGAQFIKDTAHRKSHDKCLWDARMRRDGTARGFDGWEQLRDKASGIRLRTLDNLEGYLEEFEKNASRNGIIVHHAADAAEHNRIMEEILRSHDVKVVTKGKSMLQDECGMREYLEEKGFEIYEADLGERIQQLDRQRPSHIVMPAIHKLRSDVAALFARELGSDPDCDDPVYLNSVMRRDMRRNYARIDAGMTGVNFAIASTGGIVVCTNEGNADISATMPPLYIASMGIEKLIPSDHELPVFIRLLSRSALGFPITQFTSHIHAPLPGQEMHIIIVDNGRRARLADPMERNALKCIRCGACMNTCPVFRRTSGLSYDAPYMGPIGIVLMPSYDLDRYCRLPYSCTHCGSCGNVCPVKVPLPEMILRWRDRVVEARKDEIIHRLEMNAAQFVLHDAGRFDKAVAMALWGLRHIPETLVDSPMVNPWAKDHAPLQVPSATFRQYYRSPEAEAVRSEVQTAPRELRSTVPAPEGPLPETPVKAMDREERIAVLTEAMEKVDGKVRTFGSRKEALGWLETMLDSLPEAERIDNVFSAADGFAPRGVFAGKKKSDFELPPHRDLAGIDFAAVVEGDLGVAETASVWLDSRHIGTPACVLMSRDLFVLLPSDSIADDIAGAYPRLNLGSAPWGSFLTGPSATADIEAVHVTGAQAELSLTLLIYDRPE